jgi:hypothetical protein
VQDLLQVAIGDLMAQRCSDRLQIRDEVTPHSHPKDAKLLRDRFDARRGARRGRYCRAGSDRRGRGLGRLRFRESAEEIHGWRTGTQGGGELSHLRLGAAGGAIEDLAQTIFLEHVTELHEGGKAESTVAEVGEDHREACRQPSSRGPAKCGAPRVA